MLEEKGHIVSQSSDVAFLFLPRHLLGLEAPITILDAVVNGASSGAAEPRPVLDLVARANTELDAGTRLQCYGHHHVIDGLDPELVPAAPLSDDAPVPFYLAADKRMRRTVNAGEVLRLGDLDGGDGSDGGGPSTLHRLRQRQDEKFFGDR